MSLLSSKGKVSQAAEAIDLGRVLKTAARSSLESALGQDTVGPGTGGPVSGAKPVGRAAKPALIVAGGLAGMTAASAAVSAVRRKHGEA